VSRGPTRFDVIATLNLTDDYLSDALASTRSAAYGIAQGGNINYVTGHAVFEASTGPRQVRAGQVKPGLGDPSAR